MQQRGITEKAIKYLIEYGELKFDGHGGKEVAVFAADKYQETLTSNASFKEGKFE